MKKRAPARVKRVSQDDHVDGEGDVEMKDSSKPKTKPRKLMVPRSVRKKEGGETSNEDFRKMLGL